MKLKMAAAAMFSSVFRW